MDFSVRPGNRNIEGDERQIFARLTSVPEIGRDGLEKLRSSKIAVVGVGGVGSAAAEYLARSGIGTLKLVDQDIIELSNLSRLHQAEMGDLYLPKAEVLARKLSQRYTWTQCEPVVDTLQDSNAGELLEGVDLILDGLDNFRTRHIINRFSVRSRTSYIFTSAIGNQGHLALLNPPETACLECIFGEKLDRPEEGCETLGVTPTVVGVVGCLGANEAVKFLADRDSGLKGRLLTLDLAGPEFLVTRMTKRANCPSCSTTQKVGNNRGKSWLLCGEKTINVLPRMAYDLDLVSAAKRVSLGEVLADSESVVVFRRGSLVISLFRNGRLIINGVEDSNQALAVAEQIWNETAS